MRSWVRASFWLFLMMLAAPAVASADLVWGLTGDNRLVVFMPSKPDTILQDIPISGLQTGETIRAIDFRPLDGQLYGYGSTHRIYRIHMLNGTATAIGSGPLAITVGAAVNLGFDFNPATDEIRIITSTEQNFRVSPITGQVVDGDPVTAGIQGDTPLTPVGNYVAAAHTNNHAGTSATTLFAIDAANDHLVRIGGPGGTPSPDLGAAHDIGPLNETTDQSAALDSALLPDSQLYAHLSSAGFCLVARQTGATSCFGPINTTGGINDIAVLSVAATVYALTEDNHLLRFKNYAPETTLGDVAITGMVDPANERLIGIDTRTATGEVYGVSNQYRVYTIDPLTGTARLQGTETTGGIGPTVGTAFGVDFDPLIDELRIVSNSKMNRRWNPQTFAVTVNADLSFGSIFGIAHANHLAGPGLTALYAIAAASINRIGGPAGTPSPDDGQVAQLDALGVNPALLTGFDMGPVDDQSLVATRDSGVDELHHLAVNNGHTELIGSIANTHGAVAGLAIASPGRVEFRSSSFTVNETAGTATLTVLRVGGTDGPLSVDYRIGSSPLTATPASDFTVVFGTLFFLDGETSKEIVVPILNDPDPESTEQFDVLLQIPSIGAGLGRRIRTTIFIQDDENPPNPPPAITIASPTNQDFVRASGLLMTLAGVASDDGAVASVTWSTDRGHSGTAQGTTEWLAADIPVAFGATVITVTATDDAGAEAVDTLEVDVQNVAYLLAEGATGAFFDTDILLANPSSTPAPVTLSFLKEGGGVVNQTMTLPATSRTTVHVDEIVGLESTAVSTRVISDVGLPLVVERTMRWDGTGYGAHTEKAVVDAARTWYFAEGSQGFFYTYLLLVNPANRDNEARVTYLREGTTPVTRTYQLPPLARVTVDAGADPELVNTSFGMIVDFDDVPGVAERAMYFGTNPLWKAGHESAGATEPAREWFLAEGATGPFFETFVLLSNPQTTPATVTVKYLRAGAPPITTTKTVPASGRFTINVEGEDPGLGNAAFGTQISSSVSIVVERAQYWPSTPDQWYEAHNSFGTLAAATKWGLAEGRVGGPNNYQTYILLANPTTQTADVTITFLRTNGTTVTKTLSVAAASRFNVAPGPGSLVPELANEEFSAIITSTQPIVVERAMYLDAGGVTWSAGTNATATRLP